VCDLSLLQVLIVDFLEGLSPSYGI